MSKQMESTEKNIQKKESKHMKSRTLEFVADFVSVFVPYAFDPAKNIVQEKLLLLSQIRVRKIDDYVGLKGMYGSYETAKFHIQVRKHVECIELVLSNGLVVPVIESTNNSLFVYSLETDMMEKKTIADIDVNTDLFIVDAGSAISKDLFNETSENKHIVKKTPCRKCLRTYILFRSLFDKGYWPSLVSSNKITTDSSKYTVITDKEGRKHVCVSIVNIQKRQYTNTLVATIEAQNPILINGCLYI